MRKALCVNIIALSALAVVGCSSNYSDEVLNAPALSIVEVDRVIYNDLESLLAASDLVVIGKFIQNDEQTLEYEYSEEYGKNIVVGATSTNVIQIEKLLAGETSEETLTISQSYGLDEEANNFITFSNMTSMKKGDEWIFFLYYDDINDTYWCAGDYTGRYPVPAEGKTVYEKDDITTAEFGVYYDVSLVNVDLYNDIISTFDCTVE